MLRVFSWFSFLITFSVTFWWYFWLHDVMKLVLKCYFHHRVLFENGESSRACHIYRVLLNFPRNRSDLSVKNQEGRDQTRRRFLSLIPLKWCWRPSSCWWTLSHVLNTPSCEVSWVSSSSLSSSHALLMRSVSKHECAYLSVWTSQLLTALVRPRALCSSLQFDELIVGHSSTPQIRCILEVCQALASFLRKASRKGSNAVHLNFFASNLARSAPGTKLRTQWLSYTARW